MVRSSCQRYSWFCCFTPLRYLLSVERLSSLQILHAPWCIPCQQPVYLWSGGGDGTDISTVCSHHNIQHLSSLCSILVRLLCANVHCSVLWLYMLETDSNFSAHACMCACMWLSNHCIALSCHYSAIPPFWEHFRCQSCNMQINVCTLMDSVNSFVVAYHTTKDDICTFQWLYQ
jgi:hypothetical protein